jgi:hypothetical protein
MGIVYGPGGFVLRFGVGDHDLRRFQGVGREMTHRRETIDRRTSITPIKVKTYLKIRHGARTGHVGSFFWTTTAKARRVLLRMEADGIVRRNERYSAVNDIYWEVVT